MSHVNDKNVWLGSVPKDWHVMKLRHILSANSEKNHPDMPLLSVVRERGVIIRNVEDKEENHNYVPDDLSGYKLVKNGQFVMNKMKAWQGSYGVSKYDGIVSPAYFVFDIVYDLNKDFFNRAIRSKAYVSYFGQASDGIRVGQWDLSIDRMKEIPFYIPPREEQEKIVSYLDWKSSRLNSLISLKKKEIKLILEVQNKIISDLVFGRSIVGHKKTIKALAGIVVPEDWNLYRNKYLFKERVEYTDTGTERLLSVSRHFGVKPYDELEENEQYATIKPALSLVGYKKVNSDDLVMNIMRAQNGSFGISHYDGIVSPAYCIYRPIRDFDRMYIHYLYKTPEMVQAFFVNSYGIVEHRRRLYPENFLRMVTALPSIEEQREIVREIDQTIKQSKRKITVLEKQVAKLQELKIRLISDVVTGAMDVRNIKIPEYEFIAEEDESVSEDDEIYDQED